MKVIGLLKGIIFFNLFLSHGILYPEGSSVCKPVAEVAIANIVTAICPPAGPIVAIGELIIGGILAGIGFYTTHRLSKKSRQQTDWFKQDWNIERSASPGGKDPKDDDKDQQKKNAFFEAIKLKADKRIRHKRFGNFYRDPETKLWWSKDRANHGGSEFKVFKEHAKGLEWIFDADGVGNQIVGKHKGPVGLFIPYKDLIVCS